MSTRIYVVTADEKVTLVRAASALQAVRHVTKPIYAARIAKQADFEMAIKAGLQIEEAEKDSE